MTDDVIKNPLRSIPKTQTPYEPEYIRRGVEPLVGNQRLVPKQEQVSVAQENMFASFDGYSVDEFGNESVFDNGHIIDNNDFINIIGYAHTPAQREKIEKKWGEPLIDNEDKKNTPDDLIPQVGDYILMIYGKLILSGDLGKIESRIRDIMYGDDKSFGGIQVSVDDIVVLKRINIKVGIFIDG